MFFSQLKYQARIRKQPQQGRGIQQVSSLSVSLHVSNAPVVCCFFFSLSLVSLIRGQVVTTDGTPLVGVNVSFVKYPKYGYTITRQDGT